MNKKQTESWSPKTESSVLKDLWSENLKKSLKKETHGHEGQSCDEAHPDMSHEEWEATHDDHEGCATCGESARLTDAQLTEALMVLSEDKNRPWNPFPDSWWKSAPKEEPTLGSPMKPLHKYKV